MSSTSNIKRRYQPVKVDVLGHESGKTRESCFEADDEGDGHFNPPTICPWRNNLTALSQRFNLYFVAVAEEIHVYVPQFYSQSLGDSPKLVLSPPAAQSDAAGFLDESRPLGINHLVVGDLGRDEVLVVATDSGNVAAYHTSTIARSVAANATIDASGPIGDAGVRPFFTHWVFESAWGIAIHKAARLIAISANTPHHVESREGTAKITVFAFALASDAAEDVDDSDDSSSMESDEPGIEDWVELQDDEHVQREMGLRTTNFKIILSEHHGNIPDIAFVNSAYDSDGRWLVSTDVEGEMKVWKVWDRAVFRSYNFSEGSYGSRSIGREIERGWSVMPLDPASFRTMATMDEFCGIPEPTQYWPSISGAYLGEQRESYFLGGTTGMTRHNAFSDTNFFSDSDVEGESEFDISDEEDDDAGGVSLLESPHAEPEERESFSERERPGGNDRLQERSSPRYTLPIYNSPVPQRSMSEIETLLSADRSRGPDYASALNSNQSYTLTMTETPEGDIDEMEDNSFVAGDYGSPHQLLSPQSQVEASTSDGRYWDSTYSATQGIPPLPVLHFSANNIRLTNVPRASVPHFFFCDPCEEYFPPDLSWMYNLDRMNMTACIPEIGCVIAASQTGRVVVLTLTRRAQTGCVGFRLDTVLPTPDQERHKVRPPKPLLGVAVAPLQGYGDNLAEGATNNPANQDETLWATTRSSEGVICSFDPNFLHLDWKTTTPSTSALLDKVEHRQSPSTQPQSVQPRTPNRRTTSSPSSRRKQSHPPVHQQLTPPTGSTPKKLRTDPAYHTPQSRPTTSHHPPIYSTPWPRQAPETLLNGGEQRRYRLMLTYYDHTVLSYEIQRLDDRIGLWGSGMKNWKNRDDPPLL